MWAADLELDSFVSETCFLAFLLRLSNVTLPTHASIEEQDFGGEQDLWLSFLSFSILKYKIKGKKKHFS